MVALRLFSLLLVVGSCAAGVRAHCFRTSTSVTGGRNNIIDSNAESCDNSTFVGGVWTPPNGGQGCYNRTGGLCSADPNHMCDLQIVPAGRCTYGDPAPSRRHQLRVAARRRPLHRQHPRRLSDRRAHHQPGQRSHWPQRHVHGHRQRDLRHDRRSVWRRVQSTCTLPGYRRELPTFETTVCGTASGSLKAVCSDGDPERDTGGYGTALGVELNLGGSGRQTFANMGPSITGDTQPVSSPPYASRTSPATSTSSRSAHAGTINRPGAAVTRSSRRGRPTRATSIPNFNAALGRSRR